jgi:hypothetical protein
VPAQNAKNGGTPYRAPIGYVNVRTLGGGKDIRYVTVDEDRSPLVQWLRRLGMVGEVLE